MTGPAVLFGGETIPGYSGDNISYFTQFALDNDFSSFEGPSGLPLSEIHLYAIPNDPRRDLKLALLVAGLLDEDPTDSRIAGLRSLPLEDAVRSILIDYLGLDDAGTLPAALAGSSSLGSGWHSSGWLGSFGFDPASGEPWVFSRDFGWVYIQPSGTPSGAWIYSSKLNTWLWGGSDLGRFFYRADVGSWIWVSSNPNGSGAWLYNTNVGNWSFVTP